MKNIGFKFLPPLIFIVRNDKTSLICSMVMSTVSLLFFTTFIPQLIPLYMNVISSNSNI